MLCACCDTTTIWRACVTHTRAQSGYTALIRAAENGHVDCARLMLDAGVDKNAKDKVRDRFVASAAVRGLVLVLDAW